MDLKRHANLILILMLLPMGAFPQSLKPKAIEEIVVHYPGNHVSIPYYADYASQGRGRPLIWIADKGTNTLFGFNPKTGERVAGWDLDGLGVGNIRSFHLYKSDSILLFTRADQDGREVHWFNPITRSAAVVDYAHSLALPGTTHDSLKHLWESIYPAYQAPIRAVGGRIYVPIIQYMNPARWRPVLASFRLDGSDFQKHPVHYTEPFADQPVLVSHMIPMVTHHAGKVIVAFGGAPDILIYDPASQHVTHQTTHVPEPMLTRPPQRDSVLQPLQQELSTGIFSRIFYHEGTGMFLRLIQLPTPVLDPEEDPGDVHSFRTCLAVWDKNWGQIGHYPLPVGANPHNAFVTERGFAILIPSRSKEIGGQLWHSFEHLILK